MLLAFCLVKLFLEATLPNVLIWKEAGMKLAMIRENIVLDCFYFNVTFFLKRLLVFSNKFSL